LRDFGSTVYLVPELRSNNNKKYEIIKTLFAARNSVDYDKKNKHKGGRIILKLKGQKDLIYLNVDDFKT